MFALGAEMDWSILVVLALVGGFFLWRHSKGVEGAKVVSARLERDKRLYQHIKTGMREYDWRRRDEKFGVHKDGELLFETAHLSAFFVSHFAESRVGFYFKDIDEYGLYGFFAGNDDEFFESYCRTDKAFKTEGRLTWGSEDGLE
jgi:hypothetical protein